MNSFSFADYKFPFPTIGVKKLYGCWPKTVPFRRSASRKSGGLPQAPRLSSRTNGKSKNTALDLQFEERLEAVRRSASEQRKAEEKKEYSAIDYDAPVESERKTIGIGAKVGVGVAVVVFGLVFALGDFLPSESVSPTKEAAMVSNKISEEDKANLQKRLEQYEATLQSSPEDPTALEGAAVTLAELGEYSRAASLLEDLAKKKPSDHDVFRLLGEVKYELKDYDGSAAAYRSSAMVSETIDLEVLHGLTNALVAAKKPDEAVRVLRVALENLDAEKLNGGNIDSENTIIETKATVDSVQVQLLLGKVYSDWGHVSDAVAVYDELISSHPNDFRGYLAKLEHNTAVLYKLIADGEGLTWMAKEGIILKETGKAGDAERMFIQARFFAPEKAKSLVDRYSTR